MNALADTICSAFCGELQVHTVPAGYAVSTAFADASGDRISFYLTEGEDGWRAEDDGEYLADLVARDIPFDTGPRAKILDSILLEVNAYWDRDTFEIKTAAFPEQEVSRRSIEFLSALIRVRDIGLWSRDRVRSAFRDDVIAALLSRLSNQVEIEENTAPRPDLKDFPADILLRSRTSDHVASVYLVSNSDKLNEALLAYREFGQYDPSISVVALLEDAEFRNISRHKYQRAQNRSLPMALFRGDEGAAIERIGQEMGVLQ